MKHFYFTLIFLSLSFFVNAQGTTPTGNSTEVGVTEGELSVSLSGSATYSIPIAVPSGINGVVPQISLVYNSQAGSGIAGEGWGISGVSSITRIPSTKFHDGIIDAVDFDSLDRFAFDGQRLVVKSGTSGVYGANGTVYETERFSNVKITSYGVNPLGANYGPAYFQIEYPDGSIAQYGNTSESRSLLEWSITYWQNPQGVRINYSYVTTNNTLRLTEISYGGMGAPGSNILNSIQFNYISRFNPIEIYVGGQSIINNYKLDVISIKNFAAGFRNYKLEYINNSDLLSKITEKSGDNILAYNPTVFTYNSTKHDLVHSNLTAKLSVGDITALDFETVSGDFDGDGNMDFLLYPKIGPDAKKMYYLFSNIKSIANIPVNMGYKHMVGSFETIFPVSWLSSQNKLIPMQGWCTVVINPTTFTTSFNNYSIGTPIYGQGGKSYDFPKLIYFSEDPSARCNNPRPPTEYQENIPKEYVSGDFNGDGITDVLVIEKNMDYSYYAPCDINGNYVYYNTTRKSNAFFVDLDSRKTIDFVSITNNLNIDAAEQLQVADFNGDGKADLLVFKSGSVRVFSLNDANKLELLFTTTDTAIQIDKPILVGDYNGDGKSDFLIPSASGSDVWNKFTSTGTGFVKLSRSLQGITFSTNTSLKTNRYIASDYDKDGKTDLTNIVVNRNQTDTSGSISMTCFRNVNGYISVTDSRTVYTTSDVAIGINTLPIYLPSNNKNTHNGVLTSIFDVAFIINDKIQYFYNTKNSITDKELNSVTIGNGVKKIITYQPLDANYNGGYDAVYRSSDNIESYPGIDIVIAPNFKVVSQLEKQSSAGSSKQSFKYYGGVSNVEGLGFLGFRSTMRTNWYNDPSKIISSISRFDVGQRGANTENYTVLGLHDPLKTTRTDQTPRVLVKEGDYTVTSTDNLIATQRIILKPNTWIKSGSTFTAKINADANSAGDSPTEFIVKSILTYESDVLPNKVFKIQNTNNKQYNGLENTNSETNIVYDDNNNPTQSTTVLRERGTTIQTTVANVVYENQTTTSPYYIGRTKSKSQTVISSGDSMNSSEIYEYGSGSESNLLKTIQKYGNNTSAIIETNGYDTFGNITTKTISASGVTDRKTSFIYDPTGRFLKESTDIEGFKTAFDYNPNSTLKSETKQTELGIWNNALVTGYEYDSWFKKTTITDYLGKTHTYAYIRQSEKAKITLTGNTDDSYSEELFDDLGRKIRSGIKDIQGNMSYKDYKYDIYDRNFSVSEPNTGSPLWNTTLYDVYGRPETITDFKGKVLTIKYDKRTTTVTDGSTGQIKISTKNAMGNVITMLEAPIGGTVNYSYFANGNLKETNYNGNKITMTQDGWGHKTSLTDPSAGMYTYEYNALGENTQETTPNGTTTYKLNDWGKLETKTIVGNNTNSTTQYLYTPDSKLLQKTIYTDTGDAGKTIITDYTYDAKKRLETTSETTGYGAVFTKKIEYDAWGRVDKEINTATLNGKSSTTSIQKEYKNGFAYKINEIKNGQITKTLWETTEINARGQLTKAALGNGIVINNAYDSYGYVTNMKHTLGTVTTMELGTNFDSQRGNLKWRKNSLFGNVTENFNYDTQDRLTEFPNGLGVQESQAYEDDGRIKSNTLGVYNYTNTGKKYQNTSITLTPEALPYYETKPLQTVSYNTFKSPVEIVEEGIDKISFVYNDNNNRSVMFYGGLGLKQTRIYRKHYSADGTMEIKENTQTGAVEFVTYLGGDGYSAPVVYKKTYNSAGAAQEQTLYLHRDYQGSILAITNETGVILEKRQFDAWGAIIKVQDSAGNILNGLTILDRGYTGHEHLQSVGLIHMNGRLYDPKLHRFLQPDNFVQDPANTQNFNRYGYVLNNPLKYTDPSGELKINWNDIVAAVAIAVGTVLSATGVATAVGAVLIGAGVAHFGATYAEYTRTGDWNAASNNAGISFSATITTDFGYNNSKDAANGVAQNGSIVKPKTVNNDGEDQGNGRDNFSTISNYTGFIGDIGATANFNGRYYFSDMDNTYFDLKNFSKWGGYLGTAANTYGISTGIYDVYNAKNQQEMDLATASLTFDASVIAVSRYYPVVGIGVGTLRIIGDSEVYHNAQYEGKREAYFKKYGSYPNGVNQTAIISQSSGMYRECPTCPLKFR
ncbi:FG-GAP-like repeat-containing protein [Flavobacterium sp. LS1R49]|uniref:FG-GAP-like repeat-containing protein n=1 Tax=Flavobacterium shii TaxID=2987687 RepID=A0A9X2ZBN3_9FLAO|nr:RHS repeat-associated core domain-containing protein [Flavobacterium shii]MCV9928321.1 FG-GAP-like repeat-containing protein [Flavobacterium shii]